MPPGGRQLGGDVVAQGVERDEQQVVAADDLVHVRLGAVSAASRWCLPACGARTAATCAA